MMPVLVTYKLGAILILGEVHGAKGPSSNLLLDNVLVDAMKGRAVIVAAAIVCSSIQGFLEAHERSVSSAWALFDSAPDFDMFCP